MYTKEQLSIHEYFRKQLEQTELKNLLDPLTGLVGRPGMIGLARDWMEKGIPFAYAILDLDNFKFVNDTYGHHTGDEVLMELGASLREYLNHQGVAGRFGGDEFLILIPGLKTYDERKGFLQKMFDSQLVVRRNYHLSQCQPFITGTAGCAGFPQDAQDYNALFTLMDKALYRGKTKGRNCLIVYVKEKHEHIEIQRIARQGMFTSMSGLVRAFEMVPGWRNRLTSVTPFLMDTLRVSDLYFIGPDKILHSVRNPALAEPVPDVDQLITMNDLFFTNRMEEVEAKSPVFHQVMLALETEALMAIRIMLDSEAYGILLLAEPRTQRIWQEDECAMMLFLTKLLGAYLKITGESL